MLRILPLEEAQNFITRKAVRLAEAEQVVAPILEAVRKRGDEAVLEYARKFDSLEGDSFTVPESEWQARGSAGVRPSSAARHRNRLANIREYAQLQLPGETWTQFERRTAVGHIVRPLESMGAYIPAGRYPLPSTLLMTVIPAQVAGVKTICAASPRPSPEILVRSATFSASRNVFRIGGAQAIAAMAFGTATIPRVDRIVGPGNIYVAAAKKLLAGEVGIDFVAGPTEIVIIADDADPRHVAADMLAQAEHDVEASAILLTTSPSLGRPGGSRSRAPARNAAHGAGGLRIDREPQRRDSVPFARRRRGSVESACARALAALRCDPCCRRSSMRAASFWDRPVRKPRATTPPGPNHVLPTSGAARIRGGLSAADFVKVISVQELTRATASQQLAPAITTLARAEGLEAHARSVEVRLGRVRGSIFRPVCCSRATRFCNMAPYSPPTAGRAGKLRLDFNENTVGASPKVIEYLREHLTEDGLAVYPEYGAIKHGAGRVLRRRDRTTSSSPTAPTKPSRYSSIPTSTTATKCCCFRPPTRCTDSTPSGGRDDSRDSVIAPRSWRFRSKKCCSPSVPPRALS